MTGPRQTLVTRRKERVLGIWVNADSRDFVNVPSYLAVLANRPIDDIANADTLRRLQLGLDNFLLPQRVGRRHRRRRAATIRSARAFLRLKTQRGLYREAPNGVTFLTPTLFRADDPAAGRSADRQLRGRRQAVRRRRADRAHAHRRSRSSRSASSSSSPTPRATTACSTASPPRDGAADRLARAAWCSGGINPARQRARRDGVEPAVAQHMRGEGERAEHVGEGAVADVEAAGIGAEGRHHHALAVGGEAAAADRAAALRDARRPDADGRRSRRRARRAVGSWRNISAPIASVAGERAADAVGRIGIVIAGDPDPVAAALQRARASRGRRRQAAPARRRRGSCRRARSRARGA